MTHEIESAIHRLLNGNDDDTRSVQDALSLLEDRAGTEDDLSILRSCLLIRIIVNGNTIDRHERMQNGSARRSEGVVSLLHSCLVKYIDRKLDANDLLDLVGRRTELNHENEIVGTLFFIVYSLTLLSLECSVAMIDYLRSLQLNEAKSLFQLLSAQAYFQSAEYGAAERALLQIDDSYAVDWRNSLHQQVLIRTGSVREACERVVMNYESHGLIDSEVLKDLCIACYRYDYRCLDMDAIVETSAQIDKSTRALYLAVRSIVQKNYDEAIESLRDVLPKIEDYFVQTMFFEVSARVHGPVVLRKELDIYQYQYGDDTFSFAVQQALNSVNGKNDNPFIDDPSLPYSQSEYWTYYLIIRQAVEQWLAENG